MRSSRIKTSRTSLRTALGLGTLALVGLASSSAQAMPGGPVPTTYTFTFTNTLAVNTRFTVTVTAPNNNAFYSVYDSSFNPTNLALNYLGDGGMSGPTTFSILATPHENLVLVLNTVGGVNTGSTSTFTAGFAPVPEASTTVSFGLLLALGMGGTVVAAKRKKAASLAA